MEKMILLYLNFFLIYFHLISIFYQAEIHIE